jgi:dTDP-3-amino-3,4,6-trideoxy-alpha-D-glucopyranose N,N-dimethyltransferase
VLASPSASHQALSAAGTREGYRVFATFYDDVYRERGKDYAAEVAWLLARVRQANPHVSSWLDVACGTGRHLALLAQQLPSCEGVELSEAMADRGRARLGPQVPIHAGDMRSFCLHDGTGGVRTFDVVTCLFASVAYLQSVEELRSTFVHLAEHARPEGGIVVVEPWATPEDFSGDGVHVETFEVAQDRTVTRMITRKRRDRNVTMTFHTLDGSPDGATFGLESHDNTLFTRAEYLDAARDAGLFPLWEEPGIDVPGAARRGLIVGVRR